MVEPDGLSPAGTAPGAAPGAAEPDPTPRPTRWYHRRADLLVAAGYLAGGLWLTLRLWRHLPGRVLSSFPPDQYLFEYWLTHTARVFTHGENPFFTAHLNAPLGVNVMANTATFGMSVPLVPVTLLFGPQASFAVMVTLAPALTALCWYLLFSRRLVGSRLAAAIGGAFCGFAPGIAAQDNVHPNLAMQAAIPLILWQVLRLRDGAPRVRTGLLLGALIVYQFFINEELLFLTAIACLILAVSWSWWNRARARAALVPLLGGLTVAGTLALAVLAYPMWYQFFGPQHYRGFGSFADLFGADLASFSAFPTHSLASGAESAKLAGTVTEETTFFGAPLLVLAVVWAALLWRRAEVRAAVITGGLFGIASLGSRLHFGGRVTGIPGPWRPLSRLPLFDSIITNRLALALVPVFGMLIALMVARLRDPDPAPGGRWLRLVGLAGVVVALAPLVPTPFSAHDRPAVPAFIASGHWRSYVDARHTLVPVPVPNGATGIAGVQWVAATGGELTIPGGYFIVPDGTPVQKGIFGPPPRPTMTLLYQLARTGVVPYVGPAQRADALTDLRFWRAAVLVLDPRSRHAGKLRDVVTGLLGSPPQEVDGVWLWDVRGVVG